MVAYYSVRHYNMVHHPRSGRIGFGGAELTKNLGEFAPEADEPTEPLEPTSPRPKEAPRRETSTHKLPLQDLCALDAFRSCGLLDSTTLLRLSEVDRWTSREGVTPELFEPDVCVHCGSTFSPLENRAEACVPIRNKKHRRHKGERAATARERRNHHALIEQRRRIARGDKFVLGDDRYAACDRCGDRYLPYRVSDDAWREAVPERERHASLCMACYLGEPRRERRRALLVAGLVAALIAALRSALSCFRSSN